MLCVKIRTLTYLVTYVTHHTSRNLPNFNIWSHTGLKSWCPVGKYRVRPIRPPWPCRNSSIFNFFALCPHKLEGHLQKWCYKGTYSVILGSKEPLTRLLLGLGLGLGLWSCVLTVLPTFQQRKFRQHGTTPSNPPLKIRYLVIDTSWPPKNPSHDWSPQLPPELLRICQKDFMVCKNIYNIFLMFVANVSISRWQGQPHLTSFDSRIYYWQSNREIIILSIHLSTLLYLLVSRSTSKESTLNDLILIHIDNTVNNTCIG